MSAYAELDHWALGRRYNEFMNSFSRIQDVLAEHRLRDRHLLKQDEWNWLKRRSSEHRSANLVAAELGFNMYNIHVFAVELPPGESDGAYHIHGEAVKFYLKGRAKEIIGDREYEVEAGDVILVPAHVWHGTQNVYSEPVSFLAAAHAGAGAPMFRQPVFQTRSDLRKADEEQRLNAELREGRFASMLGVELSRVRHHLLQELGELEREMESRRSAQRHLMRKSELEWSDLASEMGLDQSNGCRVAKGIYPELGFPAYNFVTFFVDVPPGAATSRHSHGEEMKYFLEGRGRETVGDESYEVERGDIIFVPAKTSHRTENSGSSPLVYFSIGQGRGTPVAVPAFPKLA